MSQKSPTGDRRVRTKQKVPVSLLIFAYGNFLSSALHHVVWLKWIRLECARDMLIHAFKRDITSRYKKSSNKCQPVFALIAGFRREVVRGRGKTQAGKEKLGGSHQHVLPELCARTNDSTQRPTLQSTRININ